MEPDKLSTAGDAAWISFSRISEQMMAVTIPAMVRIERTRVEMFDLFLVGQVL